MKKKSVLIIALLVLLIPFLFSLRNQQASTPQKNYKDSFVIATDLPMGHIKPLTRVGMSGLLIRLVYNRLFTYGQGDELYPSLANSYHWENEGKDLRLFFGQIDAIDVKKTFEYFQSIDDKFLGYFLENFESIEIVSNHEIVIHLKKFDRYFLESLARLPMIAFSKEDWTTGDFRVLENTDKYIILKRKKNSHKLVNTIKVYRIVNSKDAFQKIIKNEVDLLLYAQRFDNETFSEHPKLISFSSNEKMLFALIEGKESLDWKVIQPYIDPNYIKEIYGASFDRKADSLLHPESKWYLKNFRSALLDDSQLEVNGINSKNKVYQLNYFDSVGRGKQLSLYLKSIIEEHSQISIQLQELNTSKKVMQLREKNSLWVDGLSSFFLFTFDGNGAFYSHYSYFKSSDIKPFIFNYKNPKVDYYLDQARYSQDFEEARYALNKAVEEIEADPPGLFLFWMRMPMVMRRACRVSTELGPRYFFQALDDIECLEEEGAEAGGV